MQSDHRHLGVRVRERPRADAAWVSKRHGVAHVDTEIVRTLPREHDARAVHRELSAVEDRGPPDRARRVEE